MPHVGFVFQIRQNHAAQLIYIHLALPLIENSAAGCDRHCKRHACVPFGVECRLHGVGVFGGELQIPARGVLLLEDLQHAGFFIRVVGGHGHQVEVAMAEHAESRFQPRKFRDAGPAPGRPKVDKQHLAGRIGAQFLEVPGGGHFYRDRFRFDSFPLLQLTVDFGLPFGGTAERRRMGKAAMCLYLVQGAEMVL